MNGRPPGRAFSLTEVIVATGIFALAVVAVLALLPLAVRQASSSRDLQTAARLGDAIRIQVQHLVPASSFPEFASLRLVAARDGTSLRAEDSPPADADRYFLVEVAPYGRPPLQDDLAAPLLVLTARVSWPCRTPLSGPGATTSLKQDRFSFAFALRP